MPDNNGDVVDATAVIPKGRAEIGENAMGPPEHEDEGCNVAAGT